MYDNYALIVWEDAVIFYENYSLIVWEDALILYENYALIVWEDPFILYENCALIVWADVVLLYENYALIVWETWLKHNWFQSRKERRIETFIQWDFSWVEASKKYFTQAEWWDVSKRAVYQDTSIIQVKWRAFCIKTSLNPFIIRLQG